MNEIHHALPGGNKYPAPNIADDSTEAVAAESLDHILLDCRFAIATAFYTGGYFSASAAVGAESIHLGQHVVAGSLTWKTAFKTLLEVSVNLGLVNHFGRCAVRAALYTGPRFYNHLAEAA